MTPEAEQKFVELKSRLIRKGLVDEDLDDLLRIYCDAYATWLEAVKRIDGTKLLTKSPRDGIVVSPWVQIRDGAASSMDRVGRQLGLSPDHAVGPTLPNWMEWASVIHD